MSIGQSCSLLSLPLNLIHFHNYVTKKNSLTERWTRVNPYAPSKWGNKNILKMIEWKTSKCHIPDCILKQEPPKSVYTLWPPGQIFSNFPTLSWPAHPVSADVRSRTLVYSSDPSFPSACFPHVFVLAVLKQIKRYLLNKQLSPF